MIAPGSPARRQVHFAFWLVALAAGLCPTPPARADGPLAGNGQPITTSDYAVDFTRGPVLSSSRVTGLSGAFTAISEGVEGGLSNPASVANRVPASVDWWDYWLAFGLTFPVENGDYFNSGDFLDEAGTIPDSSFFFVNPGAYLQLGRLGFGLALDLQSVDVRATPAGGGAERRLNLLVSTNHVQVGWLFMDGQLALGGGLSVLRQVVSTGASEEELFNETGLGGEVGALLRPNWKQWRIGGALYSTVKTRADGSDTADLIEGGLYLPRIAVRPWQGNIAFAYQFGGRPLNPRWTYVDERARSSVEAINRREREALRAHQQRLAQLEAEPGAATAERIQQAKAEWDELEEMFDLERDAVRKIAWRDLREPVRTGWPRRYVLLTAELSFNGRVSDGVGVESFLLQSVQRSGEHMTFTPRIAVESEVWRSRMKLRGGMYLEPTRFSQSSPRPHGTLGLDIRVLDWDVFRIWPEDYQWQISISGDVTRGYTAFSGGIGGWY